MNFTKTNIEGLLVIEPAVFGDERGHFFESFRQDKFNEAVGKHINFVQDNQSLSSKNIVRGLHFQKDPFAQGKLVRVIKGAVIDVAVDLRKDSPTHGHHFSIELSEQNKKMFWIPEGFAHGFLVLSDTADFLYKTTNYYAPEHDRSVLWNDKTIGIEWPISDSLQPTLSDKDRNAVEFNQADYF